MIGHSHGAGQMLAAMSYTVKSDRYVSQMIGLEPCVLPSSDEYYPGLTQADYAQIESAASLLGINSLFGPDWESKVNLLCLFQGSTSNECVSLRSIDYAGEDLLTSANPWS